MGRDQADNASRIALRGAGLRLDASSPPEAIRDAAAKILDGAAYAEAARRLGAALAAADDADPVAELEGLAEKYGGR